MTFLAFNRTGAEILMTVYALEMKCICSGYNFCLFYFISFMAVQTGCGKSFLGLVAVRA
jgi:hypothetical protein